jgi:hypothetical protein
LDLIETTGATEIQRHPWEVARAQFFGQRLKQALKKNQAKNLLDIGGGDGFMAHTLGQAFDELQITCWDINYDEAYLKQMSAASPRISFTKDCPQESFEMLMLLDVLEHVDDDVSFLTDLVSEHLKDGGQALISVPAWPYLFCSHDEHLKHFRRYTPQTGKELIEASGLKVLRSGGLFHSLLIPRAMGVLREKFFGPQPFVGLSQWNAGAVTTGLIQTALWSDNWLSKSLGSMGLSLPGLSWWALCQK